MRNQLFLIGIAFWAGVSLASNPLKSLGQSKAFQSKVEWIQESQSEGVNGTFDWYETFSDPELAPVAEATLKTCVKTSLDSAESYIQGILDQVTDLTNKSEVKISNQAIGDFKGLLVGGKAKSLLQECKFERHFTDADGNSMTETITAFRNITTGYDVIFRFLSNL